MPLLRASGVTLQYRTRDHFVTATWRVSFDVYAGERFVILGPSGCGKSTILKAVGGFIRPVEGEIHVRGKRVTRPGPDRMMVFQEFDQLFPWKTTKQNVMFSLRKARRYSQVEAERHALQLLEKVGLKSFTDVYPHMLSGGMKQRAAIARALAVRPDILLMDEPFAALDAFTRRRMQDELLQLWKEIGFTVLFVTHSIEEAILVGSRILVLSPHPGRVRAELNAHSFGHGEIGSAEFAAFSRRIHDLLFAEHEERSVHG